MIKMTPEDLKGLLIDSAQYPFSIEGSYVKFYDEWGDKKPLSTFKVEVSYADEDLECALEDLAWWIKENLDGCPLIFRNLKLQEKLYKTVDEYKEK